MNLSRIVIPVVAVFLLGLAVFNCVEWLDAKHVMVIQYPNGSIATFTEPGPKPQWFGNVTIYQRRDQYAFDNSAQICRSKSHGGYPPQSIRFSEGGHAHLCGALSWEMPTKPDFLIAIQKDFGSQDAVEQQLVAKALTNAIYFSGQMMTSTESSAERRAELLQHIEDQMKNGIYLTRTRAERQKDPITGAERTVNMVELVKDAQGLPLRSNKSPIADYGITLVQTTISNVAYESAVEEQIKQQQRAKTDVQIAIANAKKAEQDALTIAKQGEATAAKAQWEQETIKAREVTKARQEKEIAELHALKTKEVAKLEKEAAEFTKQKEILLGQGESERRRLVMTADGALQAKLDAYVNVNQKYAEAIQNYKGNWVPTTVFGQSQGGSVNGANALVDLLTAKTARDLSLDHGIKK